MTQQSFKQALNNYVSFDVNIGLQYRANTDQYCTNTVPVLYEYRTSNTLIMNFQLKTDTVNCLIIFH